VYRHAQGRTLQLKIPSELLQDNARSVGANGIARAEQIERLDSRFVRHEELAAPQEFIAVK
jgi:hypothetical protein